MASASSFNATLAVLLAAKYCRQYPLFHWREEALPSMGQRAEKYCFRVDLVNLQHEKSGEMLLALLPSEVSLLDFKKETTLYRLKALLVTLKHPYILPVLDMFYSPKKKALLLVQPFVSRGSLKDQIYQVNDPSQPYDVKYCHAQARPLPFQDIARYSRQILHALAALRSKGIVNDHLSATNVMIDDRTAKVAELYLPLLALDRYKDSRERTVSLEHQMDIDLLLFGHILYEMATGTELVAARPTESVLETLAPAISQVLSVLFNHNEAIAPFVRTEVEDNSVEVDDSSSGSTRNDRRHKTPLFRIDIDRMLEELPLFTCVQDAMPPINTIFAGFRLDSSMKSTIKHSMRINASRTQAHVVHYHDQQTLLRARRRAERRMYKAKDTHSPLLQTKNPFHSNGSKLKPARRKSYRADRARPSTQWHASCEEPA